MTSSGSLPLSASDALNVHADFKLAARLLVVRQILVVRQSNTSLAFQSGTQTRRPVSAKQTSHPASKRSSVSPDATAAPTSLPLRANRNAIAVAFSFGWLWPLPLLAKSPC